MSEAETAPRAGVEQVHCRGRARAAWLATFLAGAGAAAAGETVVVPAGMELEVRTAEILSTEVHADGAGFAATLVRPLQAGGRTVAPAGSTIQGLLEEVQPPKRIRRARMSLTLSAVTIDGKVHRLSTSYLELKARRDGSIAARAYWGAYAGSTAGALVDPDNERLQRWAAVVGAASALVLNRRQHIELPAGERLAFLLAADLAVDVPGEAQVARGSRSPVAETRAARKERGEEVVVEPDSDGRSGSSPDEGSPGCAVEPAVLVVELALDDADLGIPVDGLWDLETEQALVNLLGSLQEDSHWGAGWSGPVDGRYTEEAAAHLRRRLTETEKSLGETEVTRALRELLDALDCLRSRGVFPRTPTEPADPCGGVATGGMALLSFANGWLYDFADDLWCWWAGGSCLEDLRSRQLAYNGCHPRLAYFLYTLGAFTSPVSLGILLLGARKGTTVPQSFLRGTTIELIEGAAAALGEILTFGALLYPAAFLVDTLSLAAGMGLVFVVREHREKVIWTLIALLSGAALLTALGG